MDDYKLEVDKDKQKESKESAQKSPKINFLFNFIHWILIGLKFEGF